MSSLSAKALAGIALIVIGTLLFVPSVSAGTGLLPTVALVPAAALLTLGTYLFGTSEPGRPV